MERIINPYNFISLGETKEREKKKRESAYDNEKEKLVSGWLEVRLIPSTPIIIPDGAHPKYVDPQSRRIVINPKDNEKKRYHKKYDFMHRNDENGNKEYYIPGSSLRGMIRSVYEAATDSCFPFLLGDKRKPISQRVPVYSALKQRGLLAYEPDESGARTWKLYSVFASLEEVTVKENKIEERDKNGKSKTRSEFHFFRKLDNVEITEPTGKKIENKGVLQYNVPVDLDKKYHVAYLKPGEVVYSWDAHDDEAYNLLNSVLMRDNVKGNQVHRNAKPASDLKKALDAAKDGKGNLVPVYYFLVKRNDKDLVYLSNSSIGRIGQKRKWADIIAEHGPCEGEKLCPACLLFGSMNKKYGLKSRIRVTDALPIKGKVKEDSFSEKVLGILGEPRPSAFEFYLERPDGATYWNFDYYGISTENANGVYHTTYHDLTKAMPRGRKMYWHSKPAEDVSDITYMNSTMKATSESFKFNVFFDEVTEDQLNSLIWVLTLGDNKEDSQYQHKLGHAKPLGYGSVNLLVEKKVIRRIIRGENGLRTSMDESTVSDIVSVGSEMNKTALAEICKMCDIKAVGDISVEYPMGYDKKIFTWFSENRLNADTVKTLPHPLDATISIESYIRNDRKTSTPKVKYTVGEIVDAKIGDTAQNDKGRYGVFIILPGGKGLLHKRQMKKDISEYKKNDSISVKITEIKDGGRKMSLTDIF